MSNSMLLDSNIVVMLDQQSRRLQPSVIDQIKRCPVVYVSAVTAWEWTIQQFSGKLALTHLVSDSIREFHMTELPIPVVHGEAMSTLPPLHNDPFDRLLVAQAKVEKLILMTSDRLLIRYGIPVLTV
jgi:PIN domain nuclease of toxin-antitoxin system